MNIFDILGPIMVGPSSSHTAGAVRIGFIARELLGEDLLKVEMLLHGSFASTGDGHGTDKALIAGLLGMQPDNIKIPQSFEIAKEKGIEIVKGEIMLKDVHPNTVLLKLTGTEGRYLEVVASSLGGGRVEIVKLDGIETHFTGDYPTLIVHNLDQPGHVAQVTSMLSHKGVNIATMKLYRDVRGGYAVMVIETDQEIPTDSLKWLVHSEGVLKVTYLNIHK